MQAQHSKILLYSHVRGKHLHQARHQRSQLLGIGGGRARSPLRVRRLGTPRRRREQRLLRRLLRFARLLPASKPYDLGTIYLQQHTYTVGDHIPRCATSSGGISHSAGFASPSQLMHSQKYALATWTGDSEKHACAMHCL